MIETSEQVAVGSALADVSTFPVAARGAIFLQALRDNLPGILAWGAGYSALLGVVTALYPILQENNTLLGVVRGLGLLGIGDSIINLQTVTSYAGYLALQATSWGPLILSVYLIPQTLNVVAREEERGTLDILLSTPLPRWRFLVEKTLAVVASLLGILLIMWLALVLSINLVLSFFKHLRLRRIKRGRMWWSAAHL
nr:MAG: hypothetical protein DIU68_12875 [Chloroflexota bacterium]